MANTADPFPLDAAASVDSDGDGYPDAWNAGKTQSDSTTGLVLDSYPNDSACYLPGHGDGVTCNIGSAIPPYTPTQVVIDDAGIVYLLSSALNRIYRWDSVTQSHLNPIVLRSTEFLNPGTPTLLAYSQSHFRLYIGYDSGAITSVDLAGDLEESDFAILAGSVGGLAAAGNYVVAQDDTGAWESHHIFDSSGTLKESREWNHYSRAYAWNPAQSRLYFFRDTSSPNDLHYEVINQSSGLITTTGETPYHGEYAINPPILVSPDGSRILLGSGNLYDAGPLTWLSALPAPFAYGAWLPGGEVVTLTASGLSTALQLRDTSMALADSRTIPGTPIAVVNYGSTVTVITSVGAGPVFTGYAPPPP